MPPACILGRIPLVTNMANGIDQSVLLSAYRNVAEVNELTERHGRPINPWRKQEYEQNEGKEHGG